MPALVSRPPRDSQPIGAQLAQGRCWRAVRLGRALQELEHQPLQAVLVGGEIPRRAWSAAGSGGRSSEPAWRCSVASRRSSSSGAPASSRKGRESLPERSTSSRLQNRSNRVRSAAELVGASTGRAVEAVQQPLELEAGLEQAPAGSVGRHRPRCRSGAGADARSGAGWRRTRGRRRSAAPRPSAARGRRRSCRPRSRELPDRALAVKAVVELGVLAPGVDHPERAALAHRERPAVAVQRQQDRYARSSAIGMSTA